MHTKGEIEVKHEMNLEFKHDRAEFNSSNRPHPERMANAERIETLWNAAEPLTNEQAEQALNNAFTLQELMDGIFIDKLDHKQALKYLKYGREMERFLRAYELVILENLQNLDDGEKLADLINNFKLEG